MILTPDSAPLTRDIADYPEGIIIPIDKPYRWTSADVIRKVKYAAIRHFGKKNLKVGHAGTLDPLATGVLLVCIGKATKLAETLQSHDKEYVAGVTFGATTPSYDLEKEIDRFFPHEHINAEAVSAALPAFIGEQDQIAPLFSAKSVDGVRAYELARKMYKADSGSDSGDPHPAEERSELDSARGSPSAVLSVTLMRLEAELVAVCKTTPPPAARGVARFCKPQPTPPSNFISSNSVMCILETLSNCSAAESSSDLSSAGWGSPESLPLSALYILRASS